MSRVILRGLVAVVAVSFCVGCSTAYTRRRRSAQKTSVSSASGRPQYAYTVYWVEEGDTLISIGERFAVPWQKIQSVNGIGTRLRVGQALLIPANPTTASSIPSSLAEGAADSAASPPSASVLSRGKPSARLWWPADGSLVRYYGDRVRGFPEPGVGIKSRRGAPVCAVAAGRVVSVTPAGMSPEPGWGNVVVIGHDDGWASWYAQLAEAPVKENRRVKQGEVIGAVGAGGARAFPELAFRLFHNERLVDPVKYLP